MNRVEVILTIDLENLPSNFQEILKEEQAIVAQWRIRWTDIRIKDNTNNNNTYSNAKNHAS